MLNHSLHHYWCFLSISSIHCLGVCAKIAITLFEIISWHVRSLKKSIRTMLDLLDGSSPFHFSNACGYLRFKVHSSLLLSHYGESAPCWNVLDKNSRTKEKSTLYLNMIRWKCKRTWIILSQNFDFEHCFYIFLSDDKI